MVFFVVAYKERKYYDKKWEPAGEWSVINETAFNLRFFFEKVFIRRPRSGVSFRLCACVVLVFVFIF